MLADYIENIQSLNPFQKELLKEIFRDPEFNPAKYRKPGEKSDTPEQTVRWNLTQLYEKLEVPENVPNTQKRNWVFENYSEAYEYVVSMDAWDAKPASQRGSETPEIFIKPPPPIVVEPPKPLSQSEAIPVQTVVKETVVTHTVTVRDNGPAGFLFFLLIIAVVVIAVMNANIQSLNNTTIPLNSPILYINSFDNVLPPEIITSGTQVVNDGYLYSSDRVVMNLGDSRWINYAIYARVWQLVCEPGGRREYDDSMFGVRNINGNFLPLFKLTTCSNKTKVGYDVVMTVKGNTATVTVDGESGPTINIPAGYPRGGVYVAINNHSALDYILVVGLPQN